MPEPVELKGRPASPGIAVGPLFRLDRPTAKRREVGDEAAERAALHAAVAQSIEQILSLVESSHGEAADILEFQAAMLSDDELIAPILEAFGPGVSADVAWQAALDEQIAGYEAAAEEYFRARAADIADLRDRVLRNLAGDVFAAPPPGAILTGKELTPTRFLETDWSRGGGIALCRGSAASHVAMLARARGVPMVVGLGGIAFDGHEDAAVDGAVGTVVLSPGVSARTDFDKRRARLLHEKAQAEAHLHKEARTADGTRIRVMVNVADPEEVDGIDVDICDGVGLMRTEFLFARDALPDEEMQYRAYARVLDWAAGRPVTIRTIDAGGDKPVKGLTVEELNPFLGLRGIRLSLARPEIFRMQLRALARASAHGNLKIMLPMVTVPQELADASVILDEVLAALAAEGTQAERPELGIMVEVPAVAVVPEHFVSADFFSIGSNDLTQYVTAAARDSHYVADLYDIANPAVMKLIENVARYGAESGIEVSLCGDAAGDPAFVPELLRAGLRNLSVAPSAIGLVKASIARTQVR